MGATTAKYLFDEDFAAPSVSKPSITLTEHAEKIKEAEDAAYRSGFAQATAEAHANIAQRAATATERVAAAIEGLNRSLAGVAAKLEADSIEVAVAVARKLAPELVAREPLAEIAALATNCFRHLIATPHVVVRVNDSLRETACQQLDEVVRRCGLESRLVILAEPGIAPGDCKIEWADGGISRDSAATAAAIEEAVARYVEARRTGATMQGIPWRVKQ